MDLIKKLTTADRVVGGAAIVFLIAFFLPWEGKTVSFGTVSASKSWSGSEYFLTGWIPLLLAGATAAVLVLLRLIFTANVSGVDLDRKYGLFIALLAAIALGIGGFLKSQ